MKKFEGVKYSRIVINAIIVASVVVALTSGYKLWLVSIPLQQDKHCQRPVFSVWIFGRQLGMLYIYIVYPYRRTPTIYTSRLD